MNLAHGRASHRLLWLSLFAAWMLLLGPLTTQVLRSVDSAPRAMPMMMGMGEHGAHHPGMEMPADSERSAAHSLQSFDDFACGYCQLLAHSAILLRAAFAQPLGCVSAELPLTYPVLRAALQVWLRPHGRAPPAYR